ncbi:hypothetical protein [Chthonobacter albigriseus]|uniref:hypothetical protein n=1 Tax=Chthonobacter albigriseus TaxID=1683161 RepID=UPI0015EFA1DD|nr:hypothetical protein [Chthonobacter albigriseus]
MICAEFAVRSDSVAATVDLCESLFGAEFALWLNDFEDGCYAFDFSDGDMLHILPNYTIDTTLPPTIRAVWPDCPQEASRLYFSGTDARSPCLSALLANPDIFVLYGPATIWERGIKIFEGYPPLPENGSPGESG